MKKVCVKERLHQFFSFLFSFCHKLPKTLYLHSHIRNRGFTQIFTDKMCRFCSDK